MAVESESGPNLAVCISFRPRHRAYREPEKLHREHMERVRASQRRGHWLRLTRRIAEFRTGALGTLGQEMLTQAEIDLEKLETVMNAAAQEPRSSTGCSAAAVHAPR